MKKVVLFAILISLMVLFVVRQFSKIKIQEGDLQGELIIFHAGSLSVPFKLIAEKFEDENPGVRVLLEAAGSVACARKITDLKKECDILASADFEVINRFLIPEYADWNILFAANEMVIAFNDKSKLRNQISSENWHEILANPEVIYGRSDPNSDPCGYRSVMTTQLIALKEKDSSILNILEKDKNYIRPKEVDLLGLLDVNAIDYIFIYKSVAQQHGLYTVELNDSVNLANPDLKEWYAKAKVDIFGKSPGEVINLTGGIMLYGITKLRNAPNQEVANTFLEFFFESAKGMGIIEAQGQNILIPAPTVNYDSLPKKLQKYTLKTKNLDGFFNK